MSGQVPVYVFDEKNYSERREYLIKKLLNKGKVLLVGTEKTNFKEKDLIFIDSSDLSLVDLSIKILDKTDNEEISFLVFGSFSDIVIRQGKFVAKRFFEYLMNNLSMKDIKFVCLFKDDGVSSVFLPLISDYQIIKAK